MKHIEDEPNPVIGKYYLVPCIDHPKAYPGHRFLPVLGPWHEDAELVGFPFHHFHYDWRFMPRSTINWFNPPLSHSRPATHLPNSDGNGGVAQHEMPTERRVLRMKRAMFDFPIVGNSGIEVAFVKALELKFQHETLKCRTCPHKGMPLDGMPVDAEGRVVCPGHGLRWNLKTGKLSPRIIGNETDLTPQQTR